MNPLIAKWASLADDDRDLFQLLEVGSEKIKAYVIGSIAYNANLKWGLLPFPSVLATLPQGWSTDLCPTRSQFFSGARASWRSP